MKCVYGASFKELQVFSCFYQRFETWSIAFTLSKFVCYLFLRFNYCYISFHKDGLKMNKSSVHKTKYDFLLAKTASRKKKMKKQQQQQNIEYLLKGNTFFVANGCLLQIYLYHIWHLRCLARSGRVLKFISLSFISEN